MIKFSGFSRDCLLGLFITCIVGILGYAVKVVSGSFYADPLFVSMLFGICLRSFFTQSKICSGFSLAPKVFIPIGIVLYGAVNLDFVKFGKINYYYTFLLILVILVYFIVIMILGRMLKQKQKITYLTATGSAICGASAIAMTSTAVDPEPDDVSISLIAVFLAAIFGSFIFLPFIIALFGIGESIEALLNGMTLQFSGFVKAACGSMAKTNKDLGITIKAARYLGLFIALPLFASFTRKRFNIPISLWLFLAAGVAMSCLPGIAGSLKAVFKPTQECLWSIAMAGIGLNADIRALLSDSGMKALFMSFCGFIAAVATFLVGAALLPA